MVLLRDHIELRIGKTPPNLEAVLDSFEMVDFKKGEFILEAGEVCDAVYFVQSGCIHVYIEGDTGEESTQDLVIEGQWFTHLPSLTKGAVSSESAMALTDVCLYKLTKGKFDELMANVFHFDQIFKQILIEINAKMSERLFVMNQYSAKQKWDWYKKQPQFNNDEIPQYIVASYLGISKETLSRVKS